MAPRLATQHRTTMGVRVLQGVRRKAAEEGAIFVRARCPYEGTLFVVIAPQQGLRRPARDLIEASTNGAAIHHCIDRSLKACQKLIAEKHGGLKSLSPGPNPGRG